MGATDRIFDRLVPEWIAHHKSKASDYNSVTETFEPAEVLGVQGQYADIWRKIWKLKKALWDGESLVHEGPREILLDLIGHCFLALDMLDRQSPKPVKVKSDFCPPSCDHGHSYVGLCVYRVDRRGDALSG